MPWHVKIPNALDKFPAQPLRQTSHRGSHRPGYICLSGCSLSFSMACYIRLSVLLQIHSEGMWVIQFVFPFPMTVKLIPFTVWPILIIEKYQKHSINSRSLVHFCYSLKKMTKKNPLENFDSTHVTIVHASRLVCHTIRACVPFASMLPFASMEECVKTTPAIFAGDFLQVWTHQAHTLST